MTATTDHHTIPEKLLLAAESVALLRSPWSLDDLVLTAWQKWPETFGLRNNKYKHPSDNTVKAALYGKKGLVGRGCFTKVAENTFIVSRLGYDAIKLLKNGNTRLNKQNAYSELADGLKSNLLRELKKSKAYILESSYRRSLLTFEDALPFFNGEPRDKVLRQLTELAESDEGDSAEARVLRNLADHLIGRFERQWQIHDERIAKR